MDNKANKMDNSFWFYKIKINNKFSDNNNSFHSNSNNNTR